MYLKVIRAKTPLRITFAGGSTDHYPYDEQYGGACINATIDKYVYATLKVKGEGNIVIESDILQQDGSLKNYTEHFTEVNGITLNGGTLDLIKAAILEMNPNYKFELYVRSDVAIGSGLGASTALTISIIGAFNYLREENKLTREDIAEKALLIEKDRIKNKLGRQDPYAVVFGGINMFHFNGGKNVAINKVNIKEDYLLELEKNLIVINQNNVSIRSGEVYDKIYKSNLFSDEEKIKSLHGYKNTAILMKKSLENTNLNQFGRLILDAWKNKRKYIPLPENSITDQLIKKAIENGAIGSKLMGSGGGSHILIYCKPDCEQKIRNSLISNGAKPLDFNFDFKGLMVWEAEE